MEVLNWCLNPNILPDPKENSVGSTQTQSDGKKSVTKHFCAWQPTKEHFNRCWCRTQIEKHKTATNSSYHYNLNPGTHEIILNN